MKKIFFLFSSFFFLLSSFAQPVVSFTVDVYSGCAPLTVTFTNTSTTGATYEWDFGDGSPLDTNLNSTHTFLLAGEYAITLFAYDGGGNIIDMYQETISAFGSSGYFNMSEDTACPNDIIYFFSWDNASAYLWNFGDGTTANGNSVYHSFSSPGNYSVTLIINSGCGTDTIEQTVFIDSSALPPVPFFNLSPNPVCPFEEVQFNFFGNSSSLIWDFGDSTTASSPSPKHAYNNAGNYLVTLSVANSCGNTNSFSDSVFVDAALIPDVPVFWFSPDSVCPGDEIQFNPTTNTEKYFWNFGDGDSTEGKFISHVYDSAGNFIVTLTVKNICENSNSYSDTIAVDSSSTPAIPYYNASPNPACPGDTVQFNFWENASSYFWNFSDEFATSTEQSPIHIFSTAGIFQVTLTVTNNCGNSNSFSQEIYIDSTAIPQTPYFWFAQNFACPGDEINFNYWETASSYQWDFGDGNSSTVQHTTHVYDSAGNYSVTLTVANGCGNSSSYTAQILISNSSVPVEGNFSWEQPQDTNYAPCENIQLSSYGGNNYQWNFGDGNTSSLQNPVHQYDSAGTYLISVVITNGCGNSDTIKKEIDIVGTCTFISENNSSQKISVYPNPNDGKFTINLESGVRSSETIYNIEICNILGEIVYLKQLTTIRYQLSSYFQPGIYFLKLTSDEKTETVKIIIH